MKRLVGVLVVLFVTIVLVGLSQAATTISTGGKSGKYFQVGLNLAKLMGDADVIPSKGSIENLDNIMNGTAQVAPVQADALAYYIGKHPEAKNKIEVIGPLYEECVFIVVNSSDESKIRDEDDLQSAKGSIAVGADGSGSAVTWDYMRKLEPGYAKAKVSFEGGIRTIGKIAAAPDGEINAFLFTIKPDPSNKMFQTVTSNKSLKFIDVDDSDLNDKFPMTGKPIYQFRKVPVKNGFLSGKNVTTPCMEAMIVASSDLDSDTLDRLADLVLNYKSSVVGE